MSQPVDPTESRQSEASRIYQAIYQVPIPEPLSARFIEASRLVLKTEEEQDLLVKTALDGKYDLEAIEVAMRYTGRMHPLRLKFKLMVYLAETLPDHQHYYVNTRSSWLVGMLAILTGGLHTSYKLIKGWLLLRKISNV